jgi:hypothetical protein
MRVWLAIAALAAPACAGGDDGGCPQRWQVRRDETLITSAEVSGGSLLITSQTRGTGNSLMLVRDGLSGDFEIDVDYGDPALVGWLGYFWVYVRDPISEEVRSAAIIADEALLPQLQVSNTTENLDAITLAQTPATGRMHLRRQGEMLELEAAAGAEGARATTTFASPDLQLRIAIGARLDPMTDTPITVRIDDAYIVSTAGDVSDSFDLDCLGEPEPL